MTSKEALESWFNVISTNDKIRWEEHYKVIKKDLEVLEILKNYSDYYTSTDTYGYGESCLNIVIHDDIKEYTIIKEWLENENNK